MKNIVTDVIDFIKDNKNIFDKIKKEDDEVFKFDFHINQCIDNLSKYKNEKIKETNSKKILVSHYGNPYITAMLCMEAVLHKCELIIGIENICYGLNLAIVKIVNDVLKEQKIDIQICLKTNISNQDIQTMQLDKLVCLGNLNAYMNFRKIKQTKVEYVPFLDIVIYYDSVEFEELTEDIRNYAIQNLYEIEIFDETEDLEEVINLINQDFPRFCAIILSKDKQKQEKFEKDITSKILCVNENPFRKFEMKIPKNIF